MNLKDVSVVVKELGTEFRKNQKFISHSKSDIATKERQNSAIREQLLKIRSQIDELLDDSDVVDVSSMSIDDLEINGRAKNVLRKKRITSVADLQKKTFIQLVGLKGLGRRSAIQIREALQALGTSLKE